MTLLKDLAGLILPEYCVACGNLLVSNEKIICLKCHCEMPRTRYDNYRDNPVARLFWGRVEIRSATSYFSYEKGSRFQSLIHNLKYRDRPDIGKELGRLLGFELLGSDMATADLLVPVPLNKTKLRKRGFNQSVPICQGISSSAGIPYNCNVLERPFKAGSQTNKSRFWRWKNVEDNFRVKKPEILIDKHVLLVDDVITTGSTIESCAKAILGVEGTTVSIATLAVALKAF
jgi:ComF family protein